MTEWIVAIVGFAALIWLAWELAAAWGPLSEMSRGERAFNRLLDRVAVWRDRD